MKDVGTSDWRAVFGRVRAALRRRGRSEQDADDLLQDAWIRLANYAQDQAVNQPEAFLMQVALNLSIDAHRATATKGEQVLLEDALLVDLTPGPEVVLLARERVARLTACLSRLTERSRQVILANRVEGLSYAEIAQRHCLSVSTVEKHVAKALVHLTSCMDGW